MYLHDNECLFNEVLDQWFSLLPCSFSHFDKYQKVQITILFALHMKISTQFGNGQNRYNAAIVNRYSNNVMSVVASCF